MRHRESRHVLDMAHLFCEQPIVPNPFVRTHSTVVTQRTLLKGTLQVERSKRSKSTCRFAANLNLLLGTGNQGNVHRLGLAVHSAVSRILCKKRCHALLFYYYSTRLHVQYLPTFTLHGWGIILWYSRTMVLHVK